MVQAFDNYLYNADTSGDTYKIRLNVNTAAAQTTTAVKTSTTPPTRKGSARVSGSSRRDGIRARFVSMYQVKSAGTGAGTVTKKYYTRFPVLVKSDWDAYVNGSTITVNGVAFSVSTKTAEKDN